MDKSVMIAVGVDSRGRILTNPPPRHEYTALLRSPALAANHPVLSSAKETTAPHLPANTFAPSPIALDSDPARQTAYSPAHEGPESPPKTAPAGVYDGASTQPPCPLSPSRCAQSSSRSAGPVGRYNQS